jgi:ABC-2 type transport system permease protein
MILRIARKEYIEKIRDGQFRFAAAVVLLLLFTALLMGFSHYSRVRHERESAQRRDRQQWLNQGSRNPHSAAHFGMYAFKPRLPLSFIDAGMESFTGAAVWIEAHYQNPLKFRPAQDATALQRFGELTAAAVLQWFLPLIIILLAFSAFTAEKEYGTLRQLLSVGVAREKILLGKALGTAGALATVIVPAALLGALSLVLTSEHTALALTIQRVAPMAVAYTLYLFLFVGLSLAVSAAVSSSRVALSVLLAFWTATSFLVPRFAGDASERIHPTPAAEDFWRPVTAETRGADGHTESDRRILHLKRDVLAKYGVSRVEDLPVNFEGLRLQAGEEHGNVVFDEHFGKLWGIYEQQERVHQWAAVASPLLAVRSISMAMAGADLTHLRHFTTAAEQYRRMVNKKMNLNVANNSRSGQYYYFGDRKLWEDTPDFVYNPPDASWALKRQGLPAAILAAWCMGSLWLAFSSVRRMQVS